MATLKKKNAPAKKAAAAPAARQAVARREDASPPAAFHQEANVPAYMKKDVGRGTEQLGMGDFEIPRVKLIQGISEELQIYDNLKAGDFFHTLAEESLGSELPFVPIHVSKRYVLWRPRPPIDQGGILARADDAIHWNPPDTEFTVKVDRKGSTVKWRTARTVDESGLAAWGTFDPSDPNSQPAATLCYVVVAALPTFPKLSPAIFLLQRTAVPPTRKMLGKAKISGAPIFGLRFIASSFVDASPAGDFNNYRFTLDGMVEDEAEYEHYRMLHEQFERTGVKVKDIEEAGDDMPSEARQEGRRATAEKETRY